ncbi:MAG: cyclase family protein [Candidatus Hinthialibacter antarcticus]|nr:cyclase family protein [Candidatus Hinthialibacter antarcticus]
MALYDLTLDLHENQPCWPGDTPYVRIATSEMSNGGGCNVSKVSMSTHFATHLDAPYHFEPDGLRLDQLDLNTLIGPALVHEVEGDAPLILPAHLPPLDGVERIIFKTRNSAYIDDTKFHEDFTALGLDAARALTAAGVKLVGIDYFSIEAFKNPGHPVHHELCGKGMIIVEGLDLRNVPPGRYELIALPLKFKDADGSPCRVVLRDIS